MKKIIVLLILIITALSVAQSTHPRLLLNKSDVVLIQKNLGKYPLFDSVYNAAKERVDKALQNPTEVPLPKDAGGYTHQKHKQNYEEMQLAGILYQITKDEKYSKFVREMLIKYATLYPTLKNHPAGTGESVGRLFWQTLNEAVWLVYTAQAYDCVYDWLSPKDRELFEKNIFYPMSKFFIEDHVKEFDRIHNHGTWTAAAVGMIGYAMGDTDLVAKTLYGSKKDGKFGYLRQFDLLFSPDGYYVEGAYYVRYAMMPFFLFAKAIENNQPQLKISDYRNQILKKLFYSAMQLTYTNGAFLPFNDALKEKTYLSPEVVIGLDISFARYANDQNLLGIAKRQNDVMLSADGLSVAKALMENSHPKEFPYTSVEYADGPNGEKGGVGILRSGNFNDQSLLMMKYAAHGMEHGHYDRLNFLYYDQAREIIQDYGAARFINVEPKFGGRYLPETKSWTRQTIAHNTVVVDGLSNFDNKYNAAEKNPGERHFFSSSDPNFQVMSAKENNAYPGVKMQRTMALVRDEKFPKPIVIDVFRIVSEQQHQYDLPFYYMGHFLYTNVKYTAFDKQRSTLGTTNGYQHLWVEAEGKATGPVRFTWMNGERYYSLITSADSSTNIYFTRIGANDPSFNLRNETGFMLRQKTGSHVFATVLEPHGQWDGKKEFSIDASPTIESVNVLASTDEGTVVQINGKNNLRWIFMTINGSPSEQTQHSLSANGVTYSWKGNTSLQKQ